MSACIADWCVLPRQHRGPHQSALYPDQTAAGKAQEAVLTGVTVLYGEPYPAPGTTVLHGLTCSTCGEPLTVPLFHPGQAGDMEHKPTVDLTRPGDASGLRTALEAVADMTPIERQDVHMTIAYAIDAYDGGPVSGAARPDPAALTDADVLRIVRDHFDKRRHFFEPTDDDWQRPCSDCGELLHESFITVRMHFDDGDA